MRDGQKGKSKMKNDTSCYTPEKIIKIDCGHCGGSGGGYEHNSCPYCDGTGIEKTECTVDCANCEHSMYCEDPLCDKYNAEIREDYQLQMGDAKNDR